MKEISDWLVKLEKRANEIYLKGAELFKNDEEFSNFLLKIANDEAEHHHIMSMASEFFKEHPVTKYAIEVDPETKKRIEEPLDYSMKFINEGNFTKEEFSELIIENEFSEWNDILIYVIRTIDLTKNGFDVDLPDMDDHLKSIREFFIHTDFGKDKIDYIFKHSAIEEERILIVEDEEEIANLLKGMLKREGEVYIASNGKEGLELLGDKYFRFILSDIDMPEMDGIEFYKKASEKYPGISERFVFFSGDLSQDRVNFFNKEGVQYLEKPSVISEILDKVLKVMYGIRKIK